MQKKIFEITAINTVFGNKHINKFEAFTLKECLKKAEEFYLLDFGCLANEINIIKIEQLN